MDAEDEVSTSSEEEDNEAKVEAIAKTWGYNLYNEIVEFPSDVLASLRHNLLPSHTTRESALAFRAEPAYYVQRIDARISAIEQVMKALKKEKQARWEQSKPYRTKLRGCDAVLSPIRRLSFDVVREIASHTLLDHRVPNFIPLSGQSPLNISQTSSTWRAAAHSLPQLWSTIYARVDLDGSWLKPRRQIAEFFVRAKKRPISLFLFFDGTRNGPLSSRAEEQMEQFLQDIGPSMHQVERLGIGAYDLGFIWSGLDLAGSSWDLASLKYLHTVNQGREHDAGGTLYRTTFFGRAPLLTHLSTHGGFVTAIETDGGFPFDSSSLTELRVQEALSCQEWADLLNLCPQLETGQFCIQPYDEPQILVQTHESIQELSLHIMTKNGSVTDIISQFRMPALRILRITSEEDPEPLHPPASMFPGYVHLRHLQIDLGSNQHSPSYIQDILCETVNLEEFILRSCPPSFGTLFDAISILNTAVSTTGNNIILPRLSTIRIALCLVWSKDQVEGMHETALFVDAFARMLNSRRPSQVPRGWQAIRRAFFQPHHVDRSPSAQTVSDELEEKTAPSRLEGLELRCIDWESKEFDYLIPSLEFHPFHMFRTWIPTQISGSSRPTSPSSLSS